MKYITYQDYITCLKLRKNFSFLMEESEEYIIDTHEEEIDKVHDKMFRSLVGVAMIFEKCRTAKELEEQTYKIIETMPEQKDELKDIIMNFVSRSVGIEKANEIIQKMNE